VITRPWPVDPDTYVVIEAEHPAEISQPSGTVVIARFVNLLDLVVDWAGWVGARRRR